MLQIGFVSSSRKANESRAPLYPEHLSSISETMRPYLWFEEGYGLRFGYGDEYLRALGLQLKPRHVILAESDVVVLPKPVEADLREMKEGATLWGWSHCVQQASIAQAAIDNKLTVISWEAMHQWDDNGNRLMHLFYKNNELAGYCAVHHALNLRGIDGFYGPRRSVVVFGYGSTARGVIHALHSRGFNNILVITKRETHLVGDRNPDVYFSSLKQSNSTWQIEDSFGQPRELIDVLSEADIICNCVLQDTNAPLTFVKNDQISMLKRGSLIIDVSCDKGMGFSFAAPTTFDNPTFIVGDNVMYYSVDHTPTYLWNAASREISKIVLKYLDKVILGRETMAKCKELEGAIEIEKGRIVNENIIKFQNRV